MTRQEIAEEAFRISQRKPWQTSEDNWYEAEELLKIREDGEMFIDKFEAWKKKMGITQEKVRWIL